jgi:hypothetical protein
MIWPIGSNRKVFEKNRTFTYYIPAPPTRRSGYREKEFDKLMAEIIESGFTIKSLSTQGHTGEDSSGMWVICQLVGDRDLDWQKLDDLADPLPKGKAEYHSHTNVSVPEMTESEKAVELPEMSQEEAEEHLKNLYSLEDEGKQN